eukprot:gnl/TRDRNA2_/TRDRNA2_73998_c0_seq2.p2 gnl/TRDRNA2_/TRDRNA2_73998_c0~~gnl/TRDRNA2_/TRDRNA2_73998_c0_seq2.p2  ORF type:complete len:115 (-),score=10.45 gnl/TRDRNA2_/TRDRNA2_73998_c0_seq2:708-1052(-)
MTKHNCEHTAVVLLLQILCYLQAALAALSDVYSPPSSWTDHACPPLSVDIGAAGATSGVDATYALRRLDSAYLGLARDPVDMTSARARAEMVAAAGGCLQRNLPDGTGRIATIR